MAPHLQPNEIDLVLKLSAQAKSTSEIHDRIAKQRQRRNIPEPSFGAIRRAVKGRTFRRGAQETRGRKREWSTANINTANATRKNLIAKAGGEEEVTWSQVIAKARVPYVDPTTAARSFQRAGIPVAARPPRQKPMRTQDHKDARVKVGKDWKKKPGSYFRKLDLIMDNKHWKIPRSLHPTFPPPYPFDLDLSFFLLPL